MSSTSQKVPCNSSVCDHQNKCSGSSQCPYSVEYVSADTSSSGVLIEDVLYLTTEDMKSKVVKAPIIFGCGQVQTGSFLDSAAPNGLFGLGMNKISVPSTLSSAGFASDSFSMCFGDDGIGRISFGDNGSSDQQETQFNLRHSRDISTYNISITGMSLGKSSINVDFSAIVDSGTSFTYLADPAYTSLSKSFDAQVQDKLYTTNSSIPFEYCYYISSNESLNNIPDLNFTTKGGSKFPVNDPIVLVRDEQHQQSFYCLAVVRSSQLNIIGQNFLTGLRVVFDRERMILGWKKFNCYDVEDSNLLPINPPINPRNSSAGSPNAAMGPNSYTPEATKNNGNNGTQVSVLTPGATTGHSSKLKIFTSVCLVYFLHLAIL